MGSPVLFTENSGTFASITLSVTVSNVSSNFFNGSGVFYNGSINIVPSGGTAPYSFNLVNWYQQSNGYFPMLPPGAYTAIVTDANGQSVDTVINVGSLYPLPSVNFSNVVLPSSCNSADGSFMLIGSGGTAPYYYSIDGGVTFTTTNLFTNLRQGNYVCILKDANGLLAEIGTSYQLLINYPNILFFNCNCCPFMADVVAGVTSSCSNNTGEIDVNATGGTAPFLFSIDGVNYYPGYYGYAGGWRFTNLPAGLYQGYAKDATGAVSIGTTAIISYCNIGIAWVGVDASCKQSNGSLTVHATNGTPPYLFTMDGIHYQTDSTFSGLSVGTYSLSVKDANGVTNSSKGTVFDKCPKVTATETDETCGQKNGSITATGYKGTIPYQFSIDGINFQPGNMFTRLVSGIYKLTLRDANGFMDSTMVTVKNNCLQLSLSTTNTTCGNSNGSINALSSNGTVPYQYSIDGLNFVPNNAFNNLVAGTYTLTARDANGLIKDSTVTISDAPGPQANISTTPASCTNTGGSITINALGGTAPLSFSADDGNSFYSNNVFNNLDSGQYIAVTKDANGCSFSDTIRLAALPTPRFSLGNDTIICMGQSLLISAPDSPSYSYQWQDNSNGHEYLASANGLYSVKVTNGYGCSYSDTIKLSLHPLPVFSLGNDTTVCNGHAYYLTPKFNSPSNGLVNTWSDGITGKPSFLVSAPGLYWMQSSDGGCAFRDSITVSYKPSPTVGLGNDTTLCDGQTLFLNASNNNSTYLWQDGSTSPSFTVSGPGAYSVKVDENGCDTSVSVVVKYIDKPIVNLVKDTLLCFTQLLTLDAGYPNSTYLWQDGSTQPIFKVSQAGTYTVQVTDVCGTTFDSSLVAYENCACNFYVPNGFTPNGDGVNDVFLPKFQCLFSSYLMKIYNRWGQLVFASSRPDIGWDGNLASQRQPTGTYVWELTYKDSLTGKDMRKSGTVVLVR
ncbi:MAG: gliding motility-associated C-terminal domain-containing protein [Bacteroidetes bacterium]|nr:gliding motility-associated C-terminal domain-containing protein [Bacteroidota bacterium]